MQSKIRKVHVAAREGSLRDLQAALDRRKFSTAKDEVSPKGKTSHQSPSMCSIILIHQARHRCTSQLSSVTQVRRRPWVTSITECKLDVKDENIVRISIWNIDPLRIGFQSVGIACLPSSFNERCQSSMCSFSPDTLYSSQGQFKVRSHIFQFFKSKTGFSVRLSSQGDSDVALLIFTPPAVQMDKALNRLHGLVQIWSFECLEVMSKMPTRQNSDLEENESEFKSELKVTWKLRNIFFIYFTAIIRYLGSRFQETLSATDEDNRTALHYAATIKDNGHFYNLLLHLGANPKTNDNVSDGLSLIKQNSCRIKVISDVDNVLMMMTFLEAVNRWNKKNSLKHQD